MKHHRTDTIYMVKRDANNFSLSFANQEDAEKVAIQYNQDLKDAYGDDYQKEFYVVDANLIGTVFAEDLIEDKEIRMQFLKQTEGD